MCPLIRDCRSGDAPNPLNPLLYYTVLCGSHRFHHLLNLAHYRKSILSKHTTIRLVGLEPVDESFRWQSMPFWCPSMHYVYEPELEPSDRGYVHVYANSVRLSDRCVRL